MIPLHMLRQQNQRFPIQQVGHHGSAIVNFVRGQILFHEGNPMGEGLEGYHAFAMRGEGDCEHTLCGKWVWIVGIFIINSGNLFWNSGIFLTNPKLEKLNKFIFLDNVCVCGVCGKS